MNNIKNWGITHNREARENIKAAGKQQDNQAQDIIDSCYDLKEAASRSVASAKR
jgi:hypothetical protein